MGIWDLINSIAEAVKRVVFDPTAVAVGNIHNAARGRIILFALNFFKNAALRMIPGAREVSGFIEVIAETINDVNSQNRRT